MMKNSDQSKNNLLLVALLFAVWGVLSLLDFQYHTYSGFRTDGKSNIIAVDGNSPAEKAGIQVGDILVTIDGIHVDDWQTWRNNPRPLVGETWKYEILRNDSSETLNLIFAQQSSQYNLLNYLNVQLGFIFLITGVWVAVTYTTTHAIYFSFFAIFFSMASFSGPYFSNGLLRDICDSVELLFILTGVVGLIYFLLQFPTPNMFLEKKSNQFLLFFPAILMAIVFIGIQLIRPEVNSGIRTMLQIINGIVPIYYFGWALILLIKKYKEYTPLERDTKGINLVLWGAIIGLVPLLIVIILSLLFPKIVLFGGDYAFLTLGFIPILFALGIRRNSKETLYLEGFFHL